MLELVKQGVSLEVRFNKFINEYETNFDEYMMARLIGVLDKRDGTLKVSFDFKEYEDYNIQFMNPDYYDENQNPSLRWVDMKYYPRNKQESFYIDSDQDIPFELMNDNIALNDYKQSGTKLGYIPWLEERYAAFKMTGSAT